MAFINPGRRPRLTIWRAATPWWHSGAGSSRIRLKGVWCIPHRACRFPS